MRTLTLIAAASLLLGSSAAHAQLVPTSDPGSSVRTRADLERLLDEYDDALASPAYSESVKRSIRADAELIRGRLEHGDFRVGDRIVLYVEGEPELPDTLAVEPGPAITLPIFGQIGLDGVLRSEITEHLTVELRRYIREPVVRAQSLMRLSVLGGVARPGFYTMPAEMLLGEALMVAGGPSPSANLEELRIERGAQTFLEGESLQEAMRNGLTLDQLNLLAGDQLFVPTRSEGGTFRNILAIAGAVGSLSFLLLQLFN